MNTTRTTALTLAAALSTLSGAVQAADYAFTFSGTITSGSAAGGPSLAGTAFTFSLFVSETAADLTPGLSTANFRLDRAVLDIGSDGSVEQSALSPDPFAAVYIDPGATQLVGGFDLLNTDISFLIGVNAPSDAFGDPKDLSSQSTFSLTGLTTSTLSFYNSAEYNLIFDVTGLGFENTALIPLPTPVAMGALGLACAGLAARRRLVRR